MKKKFSKILGVGLTLALLCSLLLTAAPVSAINTGFAVTQTNAIISQNSTYTLLFQIGTALTGGAGGDQIVVTFPTGTTFEAGFTNTDVTVGSTSGIGVAALMTGASQTATPVLNVVTITPQGNIGRGATVELVIGNAGANHEVVNAGASGSYTLTVGTQTAVPVVKEAAVASAPYTIGPPVIPSVPGIVRGYNAEMEKLYEDTGLNAISGGVATAGVTRVEVSPGTYDEDATITINRVVTVVSTGGAAVTIISDAETPPSGAGGDVNITIAGVTLDGFTVTGNVNAASITVGANDTTIQNCVLSGTGAYPALDINEGTALLPAVSSGNTITVATGGVGIDVATGKVATSTGDIITATGTGTGVVNNGTLTLTDANISGASGIGFQSLATAAVSTITGTTFSGLDTAILVTDGTTVAVSSSIISGCGRAAVTGPPVVTALPAIDVYLVATSVTIIGTTIADCVDEILQVDDDSERVFLNFNTITNPAKGIDNDDTSAVTLDATNNLWDDGVAPPVTMAPLSATTGMIDTSPYLVAAVSNSKIVVNSATLTAKTPAGVNMTASLSTGITVNPASMAAATYAANPGTAAVPGVASAYFDVYANHATSDADTYTIMLYGTVSSETEAYVWGAGLGKWVLCAPQVVNVFAGSVSITVTATSTPTITDLAGLPLAIADPAAVTTIDAPGIVAPLSGAVDVSLTPIFVWGVVPDAEGYCFELADNANFVSPMVKLDGELGRLFVTAYAYVGELPYSTAYYWRVKAVSGAFNPWIQWTQVEHFDVESTWSTGVFITIDEPEEELPPIVVEEAPPVIIEPIVEVITPAATEITPSWIYVIIGVGGVLVIALLVLIVRTRRVA